MRALLCVVATAAALSGSARPPPRPPRGKSKGRSRAQRRGNGNVPSSVPADESIDAREARLAAKFAAWAKEAPRDDEVVVDKEEAPAGAFGGWKKEAKVDDTKKADAEKKLLEQLAAEELLPPPPSVKDNAAWLLFTLPLYVGYALLFNVSWFVRIRIQKSEYTDADKEYLTGRALVGAELIDSVKVYEGYTDDEKAELVARELWDDDNLREYKREIKPADKKSGKEKQAARRAKKGPRFRTATASPALNEASFGKGSRPLASTAAVCASLTASALASSITLLPKALEAPRRASRCSSFSSAATRAS